MAALTLNATVNPTESFEDASLSASLIASRLGCEVAFEFNGRDYKADGRTLPVWLPPGRPKFRYERTCGALMCDRMIPGAMANSPTGYGPGYFVGESMNPTMAESIAKAFLGDFIGVEQFTEVF